MTSTTTQDVSISTSGLYRALLEGIVRNSGHVAPGVDVFGAFRFTRRLFDPAAAALADERAYEDWYVENVCECEFDYNCHLHADRYTAQELQNHEWASVQTAIDAEYGM